MRRLVFAFAIAAVGGLTAFAAPGSAAPALGGAMPLVAGGEGLVLKVHGWHCNPKKGRYLGHENRRHRHLEACRDRRDDWDYDYDSAYRSGNDVGSGARDSYLTDYDYNPRLRTSPTRSRYHRPLAGRDLYPYYRLKLGKHGWGTPGK